ncbi:MAG TPA: hypothetical protein VKR82_06580 [Candidatus Acidoferrales bacterium]|nr:hypothetical protein [Candidatus Acidoferrales bacterium]
MYCPTCKSEYRQGFIRCSECGAALVRELPADDTEVPPHSGSIGDPPALLWSGQDPVAFSVVISALAAANIRCRELQSLDYAASLSQPLALGFYGMPHWEVRVFAPDLESARSIVAEALRPLTLVNMDSQDKETDVSSERDQAPPPRNRSSAQVEIWSGNDLSLVQLFRSALLENFIPCWELASYNGDLRLFVSADNLARARDIIQKAQAA